MRAFVAMEISDEVRSALVRAQQELARSPAKVKWVAPQNIHLTLKFLGEIDAETVGPVKAALAEAAGGGPVAFTVEGLGAFPPRGAPRVVWAGVSRGADPIARVQAALERAFRPLGFQAERRFVPHLTLGRVKSRQGADELRSALERRAGTGFGACTAAEVVLFESTLTPQGAIYTVAARQLL